MPSKEELKDNEQKEKTTSAPEPSGSGEAEESAAKEASEASPAGAENQDKPEEPVKESSQEEESSKPVKESPREEESSKPVKEKAKKSPKKSPAKKPATDLQGVRSVAAKKKVKKTKKKAEGEPETKSEEELSPEEFRKQQEKRKKKLLQRFEVCNQDIAVMRQKLNEITKLREGVFGAKDGVTSEISSMIRRIRELKKERDDFTREVRVKKIERSRLNKLVRDKIQDVKRKRDEQDKLMKSHGIKDIKRSPDALLKQIEKMEFSIETEAMPFNQEKKLMDQIRQRRKEYDELKIVSDVLTDVRSLSKDINTLKRESDTVHRDIQELANKSQERHEELLKISGDIDKLKDGEKDVFDQFADYKKQYNEQNMKLRTKLNEMNSFKHELAQIETSLRQKKKEELQQEMQEKQEAVEDKIKRGKKLTTVDLLIFQKASLEEKKPGKK